MVAQSSGWHAVFVEGIFDVGQKHRDAAQGE